MEPDPQEQGTLAGNMETSFGRPLDTGEDIICFASGTMILTPSGERRIEHLFEGDIVVTLDSGPQPIRWIGSKTVRATGALAPVRFARGTIGNSRDLFVSPQHRMLLREASMNIRSAQGEVLAPASALVDDFRIGVAYGGLVVYHHVMFDQHQIVIANGAASESFHPGDGALGTLDGQERETLFRVFPTLRSDAGAYGNASRPRLGFTETRALRHA